MSGSNRREATKKGVAWATTPEKKMKRFPASFIGIHGLK
jgi:hypothetical protein